MKTQTHFPDPRSWLVCYQIGQPPSVVTQSGFGTTPTQYVTRVLVAWNVSTSCPALTSAKVSNIFSLKSRQWRVKLSIECLCFFFGSCCLTLLSTIFFCWSPWNSYWNDSILLSIGNGLCLYLWESDDFFEKVTLTFTPRMYPWMRG